MPATHTRSSTHAGGSIQACPVGPVVHHARGLVPAVVRSRETDAAGSVPGAVHSLARRRPRVVRVAVGKWCPRSTFAPHGLKSALGNAAKPICRNCSLPAASTEAASHMWRGQFIVCATSPPPSADAFPFKGLPGNCDSRTSRTLAFGIVGFEPRSRGLGCALVVPRRRARVRSMPDVRSSSDAVPSTSLASPAVPPMRFLGPLLRGRMRAPNYIFRSRWPGLATRKLLPESTRCPSRRDSDSQV